MIDFDYWNGLWLIEIGFEFVNSIVSLHFIYSPAPQKPLSSSYFLEFPVGTMQG